MIARGGAEGLTHLTDLELRDHVRQEGRQLAALTPAESTAFECRLALRIGQRQLGKILTTLSTGIDVLGTLGRFVELRRSGFLRYRDQDVGDVVLIVRRRHLRLFLEVLVDFAGRDADALQDVALAEQAERQTSFRMSSR